MSFLDLRDHRTFFMHKYISFIHSLQSFLWLFSGSRLEDTTTAGYRVCHSFHVPVMQMNYVEVLTQSTLNMMYMKRVSHKPLLSSIFSSPPVLGLLPSPTLAPLSRLLSMLLALGVILVGASKIPVYSPSNSKGSTNPSFCPGTGSWIIRSMLDVSSSSRSTTTLSTLPRAFFFLRTESPDSAKRGLSGLTGLKSEGLLCQLRRLLMLLPLPPQLLLLPPTPDGAAAVCMLARQTLSGTPAAAWARRSSRLRRRM